MNPACTKRACFLRLCSLELPSALRSWVFCSCIQRAAGAAGTPGAVPPAAAAPAKMRRPQLNRFLAAFSSRSSGVRTRRTG